MHLLIEVCEAIKHMATCGRRILSTTALFTQRLRKREATKSLLYAAFAFLHRAKQQQHHAAPVCDFRQHDRRDM